MFGRVLLSSFRGILSDLRFSLDYSVKVRTLEMFLVEKCEFFVKGFILLILEFLEFSVGFNIRFC